MIRKIIVVLGILLFSITSFADYMPEYSLNDLVQMSPFIIRGHVMEINYHAYDEITHTPFTVITIKIDNSIKGGLEKNATYEIVQLGGFSPFGTYGFIAGAPRFIKGEDIIVFSRKVNIDGFGTFHVITAFSQSIFRIKNNKVFRTQHSCLMLEGIKSDLPPLIGQL